MVALELVPSLIAALEAARRPGIRGFPQRVFGAFVFAVERASALADSVARRLAASAAQERISS